MQEQLKNSSESWSFDVWSLGVILLEIITGTPVWLSVKCKIEATFGKTFSGTGIFGAKDRNPF